VTERQNQITPRLLCPSTPEATVTPSTLSVNDHHYDVDAIECIYQLNTSHERHYANLMRVEPSLNRQLVSFQANKKRAVYRWCKYKEGFSAGLVEYFLNRYNIQTGTLLDPFAGSGTALFAASSRGMRAEGIELLPIGQRIIETKQLIEEKLTPEDIAQLCLWSEKKPWMKAALGTPLNELRITRGAYPPETAEAIRRYVSQTTKQPGNVQVVLLFALLCILESVSYTRKDGQYLRWDHRSGRRQGKKVFDKGAILPFDKAITEKLTEIVSDLGEQNTPRDLFVEPSRHGPIILHPGSCLTLLPQLPSESYDSIITSPPYCNRYDYTRTYALELALLGVGEVELARLRQDMLSCTVENRAKDLIRINSRWKQAIATADREPLLQAILSYLDAEKEQGHLNNSGIPRMVRGYFYEMACVIAECARVLKKNAPLIMVNDNVRYAGVSVSVDIILSGIANSLGFAIENILILPNGKGNSSQQMGLHGRESLRKCVYVWRKDK